MWINREIYKVWSSESSLPVKVLTGLRQVGKSSFLLRHREEARSYVTLDDPLENRTADEDPELFFQQHPFPIIIDEAQRAPALFPVLKKKIDQWIQEEDNSGSPVWLTGSNYLLLDDRIRESLAGRVSYYHLNPLSISEIENSPAFKVSKRTLHDTLIVGGWPLLWSRPEVDVVNYYSDYIRTAIEKDVILLSALEKREKFLKVLSLLAGRVGNLLNMSELGRDAGVASSTVSDWVDLLAGLGFVIKMPPYFGNYSKRLVKSPKIFFADTGLAARLTGWSLTQPLLTSPQAGALFENLVLDQIVRLRDNMRLSWDIFHWRTKDGEELDFVIRLSGDQRILIEAKLGGGDPLRYQRSKSVLKEFGQNVPVIIVGMESEPKTWRNNIHTTNLRSIADTIKRLSGL